MADHKIKYFSYKQGAPCTAVISDEGYQEMVKKYEKLEKENPEFLNRNEIMTAEDYMRVILAFNY